MFWVGYNFSKNVVHNHKILKLLVYSSSDVTSRIAYLFFTNDFVVSTTATNPRLTTCLQCRNLFTESCFFQLKSEKSSELANYPIFLLQRTTYLYFSGTGGKAITLMNGASMAFGTGRGFVPRASQSIDWDHVRSLSAWRFNASLKTRHNVCNNPFKLLDIHTIEVT